MELDIFTIKLIATILSFLTPIVFALSLISKIYEKEFVPGLNTRYVIKKSLRSKDKFKSKSEDKKTKEDKKKEKRTESFNNTAMRVGYSFDYNYAINHLNKKFVPYLVVGIITSVLVNLATENLIENILLSKVTKFITIIIVMAVSILAGTKPMFMVMYHKRGTKIKMIEEISLLVSLLKNSTNQTILSVIEDFKNNSDILNKDLNIFLSDVNVFGVNSALDRLAERLELPIFYRVVNQLKALEGANAEERKTPLTMLEVEMTKELNEAHRKQSLLNIRVVASVLILILISGLIIVFSPMVIEMKNSLTSI